MNTAPDPTEDIRRNRLAAINGAIESQETESERERLKALYGQVWNSSQLSQDFDVLGFIAPYVVVQSNLGSHLNM